MEIYQSDEAANVEAVMNTKSAATKAGFEKQEVDEGHILCAKPDTMELIDVFPDGSWEYMNVKDDGEMEEMSGTNAAMLAMYLSSEENKQAFHEAAQ